MPDTLKHVDGHFTMPVYRAGREWANGDKLQIFVTEWDSDGGAAPLGSVFMYFRRDAFSDGCSGKCLVSKEVLMDSAELFYQTLLSELAKYKNPTENTNRQL